MKKLRRLVLLGAASLLCAVVTGLVSLWAQVRFLPWDGEVDLTLLEALSDPAVLLVGGVFVIGAALLGFFYAIRVLWNVKLRKALPVVTTATSVVVALLTPFFFPLALLSSFLAGIWAMAWARGRRDWRIDPGDAGGGRLHSAAGHQSR